MSLEVVQVFRLRAALAARDSLTELLDSLAPFPDGDPLRELLLDANDVVNELAIGLQAAVAAARCRSLAAMNIE